MLEYLMQSLHLAPRPGFEGFRPEEAHMPQTGNPEILLVDDQDDLRHMLSRTLHRAGFEVTEAESGEHALELLPVHAASVRLLVTDVMMPGITGCELARQIQGRYPHIKVLFISGCGGNLVHPGACFLQKPFGAKTFLREVTNLLTAQ